MLDDLKQSLKQALPESIVSGIELQLEKTKIKTEMKSLLSELDSSDQLEAKVELLTKHPRFKLLQLVPEFVSLLKLITTENIVNICEIGGASGGSIILFSHVAQANSRLFSIDKSYLPHRISALKTAAKSGQHLECLPLDSQSTVTVQALREKLKGQSLDFLFIDGDHTYEGVSKDFTNYLPLVNREGFIAFHDIVPDSMERFGKKANGSYSGGVPKFWSEIKHDYSYSEFIHSSDQLGYGIGVISLNQSKVE